MIDRILAVIEAMPVIGPKLAGFIGKWLLGRQIQKSGEEIRDSIAALPEAIDEVTQKAEQRKVNQELAAAPRLSAMFDATIAGCVYVDEFDEPPGRFTSPIRPDKIQERYVSSRIQVDGSRAAENCVGDLLTLEYLTESGWREEVIHGPLRLNWAYERRHDRLTNHAFLNVVRLIDGKPLTVAVSGGMPLPLQQAVTKYGTYRFLVEVSADNAAPIQKLMTVSWNGKWQEAVIEIEDVPTPARPARRLSQ